MDTAAPEPGDLTLNGSAEQQSAAALEQAPQSLQVSPEYLQDLWRRAEAEACGFTSDEFTDVLAAVGKKHNYGLSPGAETNTKQIEAFFAGLHLPELALAHACARGREAAWERFVRQYRAFITQTAVVITGSSSLGQELADSLYAELYGLRELAGERQSPLASYSGRGSLQGWLRTTLVQRWRDHYRRTHRETPLDEFDCPRAESPLPSGAEPGLLAQALTKTIFELPAEDRFLLSAYFLDRQTLLKIARTLNVHEATVSRRLNRLLKDARGQLIASLQQSGLRTATASAGQVARSATSDANGRFMLDNLAPGVYDMKTQAPGFQQQLTQGVDVSATQPNVANVVLSVGAASQAVEVQAANDHLETSHAAEFPSAGPVNSVQAAPPLIFEIVTDSGEHWTSPDGTNWKPIAFDLCAQEIFPPVSCKFSPNPRS